MRQETSKRVAMRLAPMMAFLSTAMVLSGPASARQMSLSAAPFVNVSVGVSIQIPLAEESEETLASKQQDARKFIYRMASKECATLKETIAKTCRITNINISSQIRDQGGQRPSKLYLNGNAQFSITLKEEDVSEKRR